MLATTSNRFEQMSWDMDPALLVSRLALGAGDGDSHQHLAEPERRLLLAVLVDAIVRVERLTTTPPGVARNALLEAERWIRSSDRSWPCSFVNVCEALGLAHEPLRRAVLRWRQAAVQKRQLTKRRLLVGRAGEKGMRARPSDSATGAIQPRLQSSHERR